MSLTHAASPYSTIASHRVCHTHPALDCSPEKKNYSIVHFRVKIISISPCNTQAPCHGLHDSFSKADARCARVRIGMGYE